jgi:hypothetical protein
MNMSLAAIAGLAFVLMTAPDPNESDKQHMSCAEDSLLCDVRVSVSSRGSEAL